MSTNTRLRSGAWRNLILTDAPAIQYPVRLRLECRLTQYHETPIRGNDSRLPLHHCRPGRPPLSPFGKAARSLDRPRVDRSHHRWRRRSLLAERAQLGSLADARLARVSRCGERISVAVGIYTAYSAADNLQLCPVGAAYFQIFPIRANSVM
jgi:hypothetical protein